LLAELLRHAAESNADCVQLVPQADCVIYRATVDGAVVELRTNIDVASVAQLARELAHRAHVGIAPERVVAFDRAQEIPLELSFRRSRTGWVLVPTLPRRPR
jgi:hypothetical protein